MKEKINTILSIFTRLATAIFLLDSIILITAYGKEANFLATDIIAILALALVCSVCYLPLLSDKNLSKKKMIIMNITYFLVINVITLTTGYFLNWFCISELRSFGLLESVIVGSYLIVMIYFYKIDSNTAEKLNERLKNF